MLISILISILSLLITSPQNMEGIPHTCRIHLWGQVAKGPTYMLLTYICCGQITKRHTYVLVAYTRGGQICKGLAYKLVAYTCGGQMCKGLAYTLVAYNCS